MNLSVGSTYISVLYVRLVKALIKTHEPEIRDKIVAA